MKHFSIILFLLSTTFIVGQEITYDKTIALEDYNFVLGLNSFPTKYQFTKDSKLIEQAKQTRALGSNIFKTTITDKILSNYGFNKSDVKTTLDVVKLIPDFDKVFQMDFKYFFFWVHTVTGIRWKDGINKEQEKILYKEMYDFTAYLLKKYNNTGKTFMIGNWEGDWLLHGEGKKNIEPSQKTIENMTKWFQIRQRAIADAKEKTNHKNVHVYNYIEVNLAVKGMEGKISITSHILPNVDVDFVSYSSYESSKKKDYEANKESMTKVMNYIESQLKPKEGLPFKRRVFIGEYGGHAMDDKPETLLKQYDNAKDIMQISLEEDYPFALYWQLYNNEYTETGKSKNMSLINEKGEKRTMYYLHQNYYIKINEYLKDYKEQHKVYPTQEDFKIEALKVLNEVYNELRVEIINIVNSKK